MPPLLEKWGGGGGGGQWPPLPPPPPAPTPLAINGDGHYSELLLASM